MNSSQHHTLPHPGSVFREYTWINIFNSPADYLVLSGGDGQYMDNRGPSRPFGAIDLPNEVDLEAAIRAEVVVEFTNMHIGTGQAIRFNARDWHPIPLAENQPLKGEMVSYSCSRVEIPLEELRSGTGNTFEFTTEGKGRYHCIYGLTVRVYYDPLFKPHPTGRIVSPAMGETITGRSVTLQTEASSPNGPISRVDVFGKYDDFDYRCEGVARNWQYYRFHCDYSQHVGTARSAPWQIAWDTQWIADQEEPIELRARIEDATGLVYMTKDVTDIKLDRSELSVALCRSQGVGETAWIGGYDKWNRISQESVVPGAASDIVGAQYLFLAWNGYNNGGFSINDVPMTFPEIPEMLSPRVHRFPVDPLSALKSGTNHLSADVPPRTHDWAGLWIFWPGSSVMVQYRR